ncbi:MAG: hypothetical protein JNM76_15220 [Betaproteobacteria bacterium]|nr:hypothetical protein [Betaproteobacteria bacterium]
MSACRALVMVGLLWSTAIGFAHSESPLESPTGACASADAPSAAQPDVSAPAYYFPATAAAETHPALPVAITVWRTRCGASNDTALWVRMTPDRLDLPLQDGLRLRPRVVVVQRGVEVGWFGTWFGAEPPPSRFEGRFQWGVDVFPMETLYGSRTAKLVHIGEAFKPDEAFSLHVSYPKTWGETLPPLVYEIPVADQPGNVADIPARLEGLWWNPAEPGWGLVLDRNERGAVFAGWLTYDDDGRSTWFAMTNGLSTEPGVVEGVVHALRGEPFGAAIRGRASAGEKVGRFTLRFDSADTAEFSYTVNGRQGRSPVRRLTIHQANGEVCSRNRGVWRVDGLHGWAVSLEGSYFPGCMQHATVMTYDDAGKAIWAFAGLTPYSPGRPSLSGHHPYLDGAVYRPRGTPYGVTYNPAQFNLGLMIGRWESSFELDSNASFNAYISMNSQTERLKIERFRFEY